MVNRILIPLFITAFLIACKKETFSEKRDLSEFDQTEFIPTMEHEISDENNAVYAASLLFAWEQIRDFINEPLDISKEYSDLVLMNESQSFKNVLKENEYKSGWEFDGENVRAWAEFSKMLPFETALKSFDNKLSFDGQKVSSFGVRGFDTYKQRKTVKIIYYKDDDNFIIKLLPKNREHQIILFKTDQQYTTMAEMQSEIKRLTEIGEQEKADEKKRWRYFLNDDDVVLIPKFDFNIETRYKNMEGSKFFAGDQSFRTESMRQRTAFILNENGAKVESEAEIVEAVEDVEEDLPRPKSMIFDTAFLLLLQRSDAENPYFGLWTTNPELMIKE